MVLSIALCSNACTNMTRSSLSLSLQFLPFSCLNSSLSLMLQLLRGLFEVMSEMPIVLPDMVAVAHLFRDYEHFFHVYTRYQPMYYMFLQVCGGYSNRRWIGCFSRGTVSALAA